MRVATFNVNGIRSRIENTIEWLLATQPDVACLQELKAPDELFPESAFQDAGYSAIWHGQKSWNGVAILSRVSKPVETRRGLPQDPDDTHSRYLEAQVGDLTVASLYLPNGNPWPGPKFDYKLRWFERLLQHAAHLLATGRPVVLAGDFNAVPTDLDAYRPERWVNDAVFRPETKTAYRNLLEQGWTDSLRHLNPGKQIFTYWDYFRNAFARDAGLRMDHLLLSSTLAPQLVGTGVDRDVRAQPHPSDHAPVWIELADAQPRSAGRGRAG